MPRDDSGLPPGAAPAPGGRFQIDQVVVGARDGRGVTIEHVYAVRSGEYAIYSAGDVWVQYADPGNPAKEAEQRKRVLGVSDARADLNALMTGWPRDRRRSYDFKIAMALQLALDGEDNGARKVIESARADALKERETAGRLQYLCCAALTWLLLTLGLAGLSWYGALPVADMAREFVLAGGAGLAGALFSVVLAIRSRTVALDTDLRGNASDSALRLVIGLFSGGLLLLLLASKMLPKLSFGNADLSADGITWQSVLVLGFVAGFLERLVPDLLDKAHPQSAGAPVSR